MSVSAKVEKELLKEQYVKKFMDFLFETEDIGKCASNEFNFPVVGCEGNEYFIVVKVMIPTGANKGTEPYDGYEMREEYEMKLKQKEEKAKADKEKKEKKAKRDAEIRAKKKEIAEKGK